MRLRCCSLARPISARRAPRVLVIARDPLAWIDQICADARRMEDEDGRENGDCGVDAWMLGVCSPGVDTGTVQACPGALWLSQWPAQENNHDGAMPLCLFWFCSFRTRPQSTLWPWQLTENVLALQDDNNTSNTTTRFMQV